MKAINFGFVSVSVRNKMPFSTGGCLESGVVSYFAIIAEALPISLYLMAEKSPSVSSRLTCRVCCLLEASCKNGGKLLTLPSVVYQRERWVRAAWTDQESAPIVDVNRQALNTTDTTGTREFYDVAHETFDLNRSATNSILRKPGLRRIEVVK